MSKCRIISWNVNGIRAIVKKGFLDWFMAEQPDILCLQETKAQDIQMPDKIRRLRNYHSFFSSAERKGYSGTGLLTLKKPVDVRHGFGVKKFDREGRTIVADYGSFLLYNIYFPNGKLSKERLKYKMDFYRAFLNHIRILLKRGRKIILCGDVNTAHTELDLARPTQNSRASGFLPEEREWIDAFLRLGFIDTFRVFTKEGGHYTWWDVRTRARERDVGWRIDYFYISENLSSFLRSAFILKDVTGSDHCPIGIEILL
jgi:exodeoxyribonuclease-3